MGSASSRLTKKFLSRNAAARTPPEQQNPTTTTTTTPVLYAQTSFRWVDDNAFKKPGSVNYYGMLQDSELGVYGNDQHFQLRYIFQGDFLAPVIDDLTRGIKVLNIGCKYGLWSIEQAKRFPASKFIGTCSLDFQKNIVVPSNCTLTNVDFTKGLPFEDDAFDYVVDRLQTLYCPETLWPKFIKELMRVTKPGGVIEILEFDLFMYDSGPYTTKTLENLLAALKTQNINGRMVSSFRPIFEEAGLTDIHQDYRSLPVGWGPDEVGPPFKAHVATYLANFKTIVTSALEIGQEDYDELVTELLGEVGNEYKSYMNFTSFYGTKPALKYE